MTLSSERKYDDTVIQNHLCKACLDKVTKQVEDETPFVIVDFQTLEIYSIPQGDHTFFARDYMIETKRTDAVTINVYYLPDRSD